MKRDKVGQVEKGVSEISNRNQVEQEENVAERPTQFEQSSKEYAGKQGIFRFCRA